MAGQVAALDGNLAAVARAFGVSRASVWEYVERHPELKAAVRDSRESMTDDAESSLYKAAKAGEAWAVCFYLKTQGRGRGYVERPPELPPLETLLAAIPENVAATVRDALARAVHGRGDPGGGPAAG